VAENEAYIQQWQEMREGLISSSDRKCGEGLISSSDRKLGRAITYAIGRVIE